MRSLGCKPEEEEIKTHCFRMQRLSRRTGKRSAELITPASGGAALQSASEQERRGGREPEKSCRHARRRKMQNVSSRLIASAL